MNSRLSELKVDNESRTNTGSHVKAVYLTPERGALAAATAGKLFIDWYYPPISES